MFSTRCIVNANLKGKLDVVAVCFGARLRGLRRQAGLKQRELAAKVGIDFTYISKIESGVIPPPSERVILKLAEVLNADKDDLITLAGKIPSDIAPMLRNGETLRFLRAHRLRPKTEPNNKNGVSYDEKAVKLP